MGYTVIAPVGDNVKALFIGMKEFPTEKVILLTTPKQSNKARRAKKKLEEFTINTEIIALEGNILEEMFRVFGKICSKHNVDEIIVNVATGDRITTCAALSAAYANGLKAFGIMEGKAMLLPIMKLSYYNELSENKLKIIKNLDLENYISIKKLSEKVNMSISLVSYHINGNYKYKGLAEFRVVEVKENRNNTLVKLTEMGNLLLKGYIKKQEVSKNFKK